MAKTSNLRIIPYEARYQQQFKALNVAWISQYFTMEDSDYKALDHPQEYILDRGGEILLALFKEEVVGVCALIPMEKDSPYDFELAKMAVSPQMQGQGIGKLLGEAILAKAASLGAKHIYLESNTILAPAIKLYHTLGFRTISGQSTPYERCNIQMALEINPKK